MSEIACKINDNGFIEEGVCPSCGQCDDAFISHGMGIYECKNCANTLEWIHFECEEK